MTHEEYANSLRQMADALLKGGDMVLPTDAAIAIGVVVDVMNKHAETLSPTFKPQHTQPEILYAIDTFLPFPPGSIDIDTDAEDSAVRFTWEGKKFRVSHCMGVEEVQGGLLASNGVTRLVADCIQQKM